MSDDYPGIARPSAGPDPPGYHPGVTATADDDVSEDRANLPTVRPKSWEVVLEWVEQRILTGDLQVGDQLPAERELASRLGVGRSAVREAIRTLQANGLVRSSVGAGPAGGTTVTDRSRGALTRLMKMHVALSTVPVSDVTELRISLERLSVASCITHAGALGMERIRRALEAMDAEITPEEFNALDTEFHVAIAEAGDNSLAASLTVAIRESLAPAVLKRFLALPDWDEQCQVLRHEHHRIFDAVLAGDTATAQDALEQHIRDAHRRLQL